MLIKFHYIVKAPAICKGALSPCLAMSKVWSQQGGRSASSFLNVHYFQPLDVHVPSFGLQKHTRAASACVTGIIIQVVDTKKLSTQNEHS